jgi:hypothetical protein
MSDEDETYSGVDVVGHEGAGGVIDEDRMARSSSVIILRPVPPCVGNVLWLW